MRKGVRQARISDIDKAIGERLRQLRQMRGMTQTTLGEAVNVTFQQMQKYERGLNRIAASTLVGFCNALKVTPMEILGGFVVEEMQSEGLQLLEKLHDAENRLRQIHDLSKS
ncbi:MAG: helix-turn-helix transcriptional regulator [Rhizobium sp.]|uniref:helix-turn-helix domain-containing protein n=1 Tax=Rhizobium sp. TaxID=391 RepID=UPI00068BC011